MNSNTYEASHCSSCARTLDGALKGFSQTYSRSNNIATSRPSALNAPEWALPSHQFLSETKASGRKSNITDIPSERFVSKSSMFTNPPKDTQPPATMSCQRSIFALVLITGSTEDRIRRKSSLSDFFAMLPIPSRNGLQDRWQHWIDGSNGAETLRVSAEKTLPTFQVRLA